MQRLYVYLDAVGNPDFRQDPNQPPYGVTHTAFFEPCASYDHASAICRAYIDRFDLGGGNWTGGCVISEDGEQVAYISYNGEIWTERGQFPTFRKPIVDRYERALKRTENVYWQG